MTEQTVTNEPMFSLLVPRNSAKLVELLEADDRGCEYLEKDGGHHPFARVNLGTGVAMIWGLSNGHHRTNARAQNILATWTDVYFELRGPVIFTGISARQAIEMVRIAQDQIRTEATEQV